MDLNWLKNMVTPVPGSEDELAREQEELSLFGAKTENTDQEMKNFFTPGPTVDLVTDSASEIGGNLVDLGGDIKNLVLDQAEQGRENAFIMGENYAAGLPVDEGVVDAEQGSYFGYDPSNAPARYNPEDDPKNIPPINDAATIAAMEQSVAQEAENARQAAVKIYKPEEQDQNTEKGFFDMVLQVGEFVGKPLALGWEQWMKLAPSTRTAIVGAAATAYAYSRGWKETAGDVAIGFGNLYGQQMNDAAATQRTVLEQVGANQRAGVEATNEAQIKAQEKMRDQLLKSTSTEAINDFAQSQVAADLMTDEGWLWDDVPKPENVAYAARVMSDTYNQGVLNGMINVPFSHWAANKDLVKKTIEALKAEGIDLYN